MRHMEQTANNNIPEILMLDLGNVLIDLEIERFHTDVEKRLKRKALIGNVELHHQYMAGQFDEEIMRHKISEKYGLFFDKDSFSDFWCGMLGKDRVELLPYLDKLRGKMKLALCSNTDATHIRYLKDRKSKMIEGFDFYCYSFDLGFVKPDKAYFVEALKKMSISAEKCLFLDDGLSNIEAASSLGISTIYTPDVESVISALETLLNKI